MSPEQQLEIMKMMIVDFILAIRSRNQERGQQAFTTLSDMTDAILRDLRSELAAEEADALLTKMKAKV